MVPVCEGGDGEAGTGRDDRLCGGDGDAVAGGPRVRGGDGGAGPGPGPNGTEGAVDWRAVAAAVVAAGYPGGARSPEYHENWPDCARLGPHVAALADDPPAVAATDYLLNQASIYLGSQRRDAQALVYAEASLRLKEARLGAAHEDVGIACNNLAGRLWRLGRVEEAEAMAARAVEIDEAAGVPDERRAVWLSTHGIWRRWSGAGGRGGAARQAGAGGAALPAGAGDRAAPERLRQPGGWDAPEQLCRAARLPGSLGSGAAPARSGAGSPSRIECWRRRGRPTRSRSRGGRRRCAWRMVSMPGR